MTHEPPPISLPPRAPQTTAPTTTSTASPADRLAPPLPTTLPSTPSVTVFLMVGFWAVLAGAGTLLARSTAWRRTPTTNAGDDEPAGDPLVLWCGAAILFLVQLVFGVSILPKLQQAVVHMRVADEVSMIGAATMYLVGLAGVWLMHASTKWDSLPAIGAGRGPSSRDLGKALTAAFVAIPLTNAALLMTQWAWERLSYQHESVHVLLQLMGRDRQSPAVLMLTIVVAVVLAPVYEEVMFRGHIQSAIARALPWSRWLPIVVTSLLFAAMHETWMMPPIFVLSLALGYAYQRSRSLWVSILMHMTFNGVSTATFLLTRGA